MMKMFNLNYIWIAMSCLILVPCLTFGRPSLIPAMNSRRLNAVDYGRIEKPYSLESEEELPSEKPPTKECNCKCEKPTDDILNDVELFVPSSTTPKTAKLRQPLPIPIHNVPSRQLMPTSCLSYPRTRKTRPSVNTYPIGDIKFDIDTRKTHGNLNTTVIAKCNFLVGLDNFQKTNNRPQDYILIWSRLKTRCPMFITTGGIKEGKGEVAIQVESLYMRVKMSPGDLRVPPQIEMSEVKKASVSIEDLEGFAVDYSREISAEIEKTVLCIVNSEIRNVLRDSLECHQDGSSTSCKLVS